MISDSCRRRSTCRLCRSGDLELVLELTPTPPANAFVSESHLNEDQAVYPLDVYFCRVCSHVQLLDVVDPVLLFSDYVYVSGTSTVFVDHFRRYAEQIMSRFEMMAGSLVVDIGSNDGTLLSFFQKAGMTVLGVDPARNLAEQATQNGIETLVGFFDRTTVDDIVNLHGQASIVTANNIFAHADDLSGISSAIRSLLSPDGVFVFEVSYLGDVVAKTLFDTIYHEHLSYHTVAPLQLFFVTEGLDLIGAYPTDSHGGSLRGICQLKGGPHMADGSVDRMIAQEITDGINSAETFKDFAKDIDRVRHKLTKHLAAQKEEGKSNAGFGAPAKATTLMYHFGIGPETVDFIVDDNPLKQNLYSPGLHVPIVPTSEIYDRKPDNLILLAWNYADSIVQNHQSYAALGGKFIVPLPEVLVI